MKPVPLDPEEQEVWRRVAMLLLLLPRALEDDLQRGTGLSLTHYSVLLHLSEAPGRALRMSDLALRASISPSRMTRVVQHLEAQGWVTRCGSADDRRAYLARLTDAGLSRLEEAWPTHLASVRRLVVDHLDHARLPDVARVLGAIVTESLSGGCAGPTD
jgi:DNA-binding MarR family transcriptional regulator